MCGIICILGRQAAVPLLVEGLKRLAYRGYDSAGVATLGTAISIAAGRRASWPISRPRWRGRHSGGWWASAIPAGRPNETNAHPHATDHVAIVHNGIIENF